MAYCKGCGAKLQDKDPLKSGYIPHLKVDGLCQRCFKIQHYHQKVESYKTDQDFLQALDSISETNALVVYIIDVFDLQGSLIPGLLRHIGNNDVYVLANKRDILPKSLKDKKIINYVKRVLKNDGLSFVDITLTSGKKILNFDEIYEKIQYYRQKRDVYIIGMANVGKSTFIDALLRHYTNSLSDITISEFPGTTLDFIKIPLDENSYIYDSPGITNEKQLTYIVSDELLKNLVPQKEVKARTYQIYENQSFYIGEYARIDFLGEGSLTFYISDRLNIHRTKYENADNLFNRHKQLQPQITTDSISTYQCLKYEIVLNKEIYISGLGFVSVRGQGQIQVHVPQRIDVYYRERMI